MRPAGGLVSALRSALKKRSGLWFGWSGEATLYRAPMRPKIRRLGSMDLATIDLTKNEVNEFYREFSNRTLWPLFHGFTHYVSLSRNAYSTYLQVNHRFASSLFPLLRHGDLVWVHDYHLIPLGAGLRQLGWTGHLGFFLHIPFPSVDTFTALPWSQAFLKNLMAYDLLGFHTEQYSLNFVDALDTERGRILDGDTYRRRTSSFRVGVYPVGTEPELFTGWAHGLEAIRYRDRLRRLAGAERIVLGVDRLDYTKGITHRLAAFEKLLECSPSWHRRVSMIQISAPSRTNVPEYKATKGEVDQLVKRINRRFSSGDWIPIHHLYHSYSQKELCAFYREADVCLVTPLRDGMNLVAKEYIASQVENPGVLVLSRFCGAAENLREAMIINPYDTKGTANTLKQALEMPLREREVRWGALNRRVRTYTAQTWSDKFLADLIQTTCELQRQIA